MINSSRGSSSSVSIQQKVQWAHDLYRTSRRNLLSAPQVRGLLNKLQQSIDTTKQTIRELGIYGICRHCDEEEGGSCCGAGIENKYEVVLLLVNLLLGICLPEQRGDPTSCYFAGDEGCVLLARHVLCVNYICSEIERKIPTGELIRLQYIAGNELNLLFTLQETIKKFINHTPNDQRLLKSKYLCDHQFL